MKDTVYMKSPSGEVREVEATQEILTPLMAKGWHQTPGGPIAKPAAPRGSDVSEEGK